MHFRYTLLSVTFISLCSVSISVDFTKDGIAWSQFFIFWWWGCGVFTPLLTRTFPKILVKLNPANPNPVTHVVQGGCSRDSTFWWVGGDC